MKRVKKEIMSINKRHLFLGKAAMHISEYKSSYIEQRFEKNPFVANGLEYVVS
jgi:hypothetical protein